ncbi:hypothetical protein PR048_004260 [Dryococelus australis]|uniref:Uncharacterized protein n=1 Tax=Dryococelus australis TaxID=614101 RepID=A0ABQ9I521_9NEOP|nr:hypothetical protein PR048_004260 [Dryococelus australis]
MECHVAGRDMEPGREGGSWFAVSKKGRISTLLNVVGGTFVDMRSRGSIVPEYLTAETSTANHLSDLEARAHEFSLFNLLAVDVRRDGIDVHQISNVGDTRKTFTRGQGFLGIGNHLLGHPTHKVSAGLTRFKDVVGELGRVEAKDELLEQLLSLLKWNKK